MLLSLASEQCTRGIRTTICSIGAPGAGLKPIEAEASARNLDVVSVRMLPGPNPVGATKVLSLARRGGYDLIHSHGYKGNILLGMVPRPLRRLPIVSTLHGWTSTGGISKIRLYEWADSRVLDHLDAVVLVNPAMVDHPRIARLRGVRIAVIPNGIPVENSSAKADRLSTSSGGTEDEAIKAFCSSGFIVGAIGRLAREKGFDILLHSIGSLRDRGLPVKLVIIGAGYERAELEQTAVRYGLTDRVLFAGYRRNAHSYLGMFDVFVLSSLTEGLPISLLEAMRARVPIVATSVGAIPEVLRGGEGGMLVAPRDPNGLAHAVERLYQKRDLGQGLADIAARILRERYSSSAMAESYREIYEEVLQHRMSAAG